MRGLVCWSLTSLCHSNGHIETMLAREINPFTGPYTGGGGGGFDGFGRTPPGDLDGSLIAIVC